MRERSGTRTEHARRRPSRQLIATTTMAAGIGMVAVPSGAVPAQPTRPHGGAAPPPVPVADGGTSRHATVDTEIEEIHVPRVDGVGLRPGAGRTVVARLGRQATEDFALVGLTWREGTAPEGVEVQVRTRGGRGWSDWRHLHVHPAEGPAPEEEQGPTRDGTDPLWVDSADGVQARVLSPDGTAPVDPEMVLVDPGSGPPAATPAVYSGTSTGAAVSASPAVLTGPVRAPGSISVATAAPRLVSRRAWGADPRLKSPCSPPRRARTVQMTFVHHTAGSNDYRRSESKALMRSIYAYHTQGHGWCDIGYNFLVDRFGRVFVGRAGGPNTPVRGAHAGDYNVKAVGVSLMGNFERARPTRAMKRGLTRLLAWKLSSYYRYPRTKALIAGRRFEKISGHRDAMSTACPGRYVYNWLPRLRDRVARRAGRIETPISRKWRSLRRTGTNLGQPFRGETRAPHTGRKTEFGRGWVFWNDRPGAHPVRGRIYRRYRAWGQAGGRLGYPRTDVRQTRHHRGSNQAFQRGRIYRVSDHGAVAVWGRISRRYTRTGLATGRLGVPVRDQYRIRRGWAAGFEHGRITWNTTTGRTRVRYS